MNLGALTKAKQFFERSVLIMREIAARGARNRRKRTSLFQSFVESVMTKL
jgi:hypothetical protein